MLVQTRIRDDLEAWNSALSATCGDFRASVEPDLPIFIGDLDHQKEESMEVATIRTNANLIVHGCANSDRHDDRHCFLVMQRSGTTQMRHNGSRVFDMYPGDMMLMDSIVPCDIVPCGLIDQVSIHLDRNQLKRHLPAHQRLFGKVPTANVSGHLLHGMVKQLIKESEELSCSEGQTMQEVIVLLLSQALRSQPAPARIGTEIGKAPLRRCAEQLIEQQLDNALLTPTLLATRLGISLRQLYRLFDNGPSICRYIQQRRLLRSAEDLQSPHLRHESITHIAYRWGFTDSAHFSRVFKKQFGCTPSEYRNDDYRVNLKSITVFNA